MLTKLITAIVWLCLALPISAQVKIGNNPTVVNKSSILELESDSLGLLLPRVQDTILINKLNPPDGMLIFIGNTGLRRAFVRQSGHWAELMTEIAIRTFINAGNVTVSDTTLLFSNLLRKNDTLAMLSPYQRVAFPVTVPAQPNITSVGILTSLTVSGTVTAGSFSSPSASITNILATGMISGGIFSGTLSQTAMNSITNLGNLSSITVTGNISAGTLSIANGGILGGNL
ncbi:MAG: hypothetical protein ABI581_14900, partial [Sediminibacterium sp.]